MFQYLGLTMIIPVLKWLNTRKVLSSGWKVRDGEMLEFSHGDHSERMSQKPRL